MLLVSVLVSESPDSLVLSKLSLLAVFLFSWLVCLPVVFVPAGDSGRRWRVYWEGGEGGAGNTDVMAKLERGGGATLIPLSSSMRSDL